jgi:hypothetical protein
MGVGIDRDISEHLDEFLLESSHLQLSLCQFLLCKRLFQYCLTGDPEKFNQVMIVIRDESEVCKGGIRMPKKLPNVKIKRGRIKRALKGL